MSFGDNKSPDATIRKLELQIAGMYNAIHGTGGILFTLENQGQSIYGLVNNQANSPAAPVGNLLWNGEIGHSAHTWHDLTTPPAQANKNREAAWWYSHQTPANSATFTSADVDTLTGNLVLPDHGMATGTLVSLLANTNGGTGGSLPTGWTAFSPGAYIIVVDPGVVRLATSFAAALAGTATVPSTTGVDGTQPFGIEPLLLATYTTATAGSDINQELKTYEQTASYFPQLSRWNATNGWAELTGTTTIDQPLPMNFIDATVNLARVSLIAAKANSYIEIPDAALLSIGLFDNTSGQRKFLEGSIGLAASFNGTPDPTTGVERRFRVLLTSDRGYQLLSEEVSVANTPTTLDSTHNITLSWAQQAGQLQVDIYERYDPSGVDDYYLIAQVSSATSFIYLGDTIRTATGYPSSTGDIRSAIYTTQTLDMADLGVNGATWDTIGAPIQVPDNYNKALTTDRQWLRIWMTQAANLLIPDVITDGTATIVLPDGAINSAAFASGGYGTGSAPYTTGAAGQSLYVDLVVQVYDEDDVLLATTSVDTVTSNTSIDLATTIAAGANRTVRIIGAGFHGIYLDKIHLGFQQNTSYAPNALDVRALQPLAAPASSSQGGVGDGGIGGGIIGCVATGTPIKLGDNTWGPVERSSPGHLWASGAVKPNMLAKLRPSQQMVRWVRSANGVEVLCTDTEKFMTDRLDPNGTSLFSLRVGDKVLTEINGVIELSELVEIGPHVGRMTVFSPTVTGTCLFVAGELKAGPWQKMKNWLFRSASPKGGFVLHNKPEGGGIVI